MKQNVLLPVCFLPAANPWGPSDSAVFEKERLFPLQCFVNAVSGSFEEHC